MGRVESSVARLGPIFPPNQATLGESTEGFGPPALKVKQTVTVSSAFGHNSYALITPALNAVEKQLKATMGEREGRVMVGCRLNAGGFTDSFLPC